MTCWLCGFKTTELATNANAPTCKNGPCQICIAVANIDKEINQAVATLRRLLTKRCDLRSEQNRVHGTLVHKLPKELKNYIFELLLPTRTEWGQLLPSQNTWGRRRPRIERLAIPLYAIVCRDWRDNIWSNPSLWSTIHIALGSNPPPPSDQFTFMHNRILRSQFCPLTLHIVAHGMGCSEQEFKGVIDAISQCSNRWHSLSLDMPFALLSAFLHSNLQCRLLRSLRIHASGYNISQSVSSLNTTISPEKVEIRGVPFHSLQISWNHLTSADVQCFNLENLVHLFQHASQMTCCHILEPRDEGQVSPIPPIVHHRLKTLSFFHGREAKTFLESLTLPGLQEFHANEILLLDYLPALVHRSSCPLTRITFELVSAFGGSDDLFDHLQPLPGMTDLVIGRVEGQDQIATIKRLLLEEYFPDLRNLTLRPHAFQFLWNEGVISLLLDHKRSRLGAGNGEGGHLGEHPKILVIGGRTDMSDVIPASWQSDVGELLKALQVDFNLGDDGFEILIPEDDSSQLPL